MFGNGLNVTQKFFVKWSSFETTTYPPKTSIKKISFLFIFELLAHLFARMKNKILLDKITVGRAQSCLIANHFDQNPDSLMEVNFTWMWQYILSFCPPWQWTNKKCKFCVFSKDPFVVEKYSIHWAQLTLGYFRTVWFISGNPCKDPSPCRTVFFLESLLFTERPDKDPDSVYFFPHQLHLIFFVNTSGFCSMKSTFCCQPVCLHHVLQSPPTSVGSWWLLSTRRWAEVLPISQFLQLPLPCSSRAPSGRCLRGTSQALSLSPGSPGVLIVANPGKNFDYCPQARIYIFNKLPLGLPLTWLGEHQYLPECLGDTDAIVNEERIEREVNGDTTT